MSSLFRIVRPLRPTAFRTVRTLNTLHQSKTKMPSTFFSSSDPSLSSVGLRHTSPNTFKLSRLLQERLYGSGPKFSYSPDINMKIIYAMIGINVGVFGYYQFVTEQARQGDPKLLISWSRNFTLNLNDAIKGGYWWQTITSVFAHMGPLHLAGNMISIYYFGQLVAYTPGIGPGKLLTLIIGSGISGSLGFLFQRAQKLREHGGGFDHRRALGFSGAVMGVGATAACMHPRTQFLLYGIVPLPLWALIGGYMLYDGYYLDSDKSNVGHSGHLGGLAFGLAYYFLRLRGTVLRTF